MTERTAAERTAREFLKRNERYLVPGMLIAGVALDALTFRTIEIRSAFALLGAHAVVVGAAIAYLNAYAERPRENRILAFARMAAPLLLQFSLGALLSASLVFYWFSGALSASWPIFALFALLMISNDVLREKYLRPMVQISIYYFALFSLFSLILPHAFRSISPGLFPLSGIAAALVIAVYVAALSRAVPGLARDRHTVAAAVAVIFVFLNGLYFLNVIPPIPLSLRDAGAFHRVERAESGYLVLEERESLLERIIPGQTLHVREGERAYVFTEIYAPTDLTARIAHEWHLYDEDAGEWVSRSRPSFPIIGGREDGYRGFSLFTSPPEGRWRVDVETRRGQVIGRVFFRVEREGERELIERMK